jgi:DNA anti-recombination protein RmuC
MLLAVLLFLVLRPDTASEKIAMDNRELKELMLTLEKSLLNIDKKIERNLNSLREQNSGELNKMKDFFNKKLSEITEER